MLPKKSRLPRTLFAGKGFQAIRTPYFLLKTRANGTKNDRVGIVVGTSVHKTAVKRNFWKRQAKAEVSLRSRSAKNGEGRDMIIIFSSNVNGLTKKQFKEKLSAALGKAAGQ